MKTPARPLLAAALAAGVLGCASFAGVATLRGSDAATTDLAGEAKAYAGRRPGSGAPIARSFKEQPPLVPHAVDNFDEITVAENQCLDCHSPATADKKKAPKVGDSHLAAGNLKMDRYQCNTCHVPQVDAPPLVRSTFATR
jgi:cytochrome c-type protein NapB